MYLDYSKLEASQIKQPALRLQTLAGKELGVTGLVLNVWLGLGVWDYSHLAGNKAWYAVLKTSEDGGESYWGREYVEVV